MESPYDTCYDYMSPRAVVLSVPPPTTNALSPVERARLLRSSKKIARVLGATPRFLDTEIDNVTGIDNAFIYSPSVYRSSVDTIDSLSSSSTTSSDCSTSTGNTSISSSHSLRRLQKPLPLALLQDVWPSRKHLRPKLSLETSLESIPASPLTSESTHKPMSRTIPSHRGSPPSSLHRGTIAEPNSLYSSPSSPSSPSFKITTHAAARRRKLDRLRRTLGDDVPVYMILPQTTAESDSESSPEPSPSSFSGKSKTSSSDDLTTPNTSPVSATSSLSDFDTASTTTKPENKDNAKDLPRPRKKKIAHSRDSLTLPFKPTPCATTSPSATKPASVHSQSARVPPPRIPASVHSQSARVPPPRIPASVHSQSARAPPPRIPACPSFVPSRPPGLWLPAGPVRVPGTYPITLPLPTPPHTPPSAAQAHTHLPIAHRRSHSGASSIASVGSALGSIPEEKSESGWYESDDEADKEVDFIKEDEVLGAACRLGDGDRDGGAVLYGGPVRKGMGRGLARSYANGGY